MNLRGREPILTFCILHYKRPWCLKECVGSIMKHTTVPFRIMILQQGPMDKETERYLSDLQKKEEVNVIYSEVNLGCGGGRRVLVQRAETPIIMTLDDDIYVTKGWIGPVLKIFSEHHGDAVGIPQFTRDGKLLSLGGDILKINRKSKIIKRIPLPQSLINSCKLFVKVSEIFGGVMIFRREMKSSFMWDGRYLTGFSDLDKSMQILFNGRWKQVICLKSRVIHDKDSERDNSTKYSKIRYNYLEFYRSYYRFREKWGYRLAGTDHIYYKYICLLDNRTLAHLFLKSLKLIRKIRTRIKS